MKLGDVYAPLGSYLREYLWNNGLKWMLVSCLRLAVLVSCEICLYGCSVYPNSYVDKGIYVSLLSLHDYDYHCCVISCVLFLIS